jgi:hypothetical protein
MSLLDEPSFLRTFGKKMVRVNADGDAPIPFWSYVDSIPKEDFQGYDCSEGSVRWVWRSDDHSFEHICIDTKEDGDVFMVIVLDLARREVAGHRLMDLKREYGLRDKWK